MQIYIPNLSQTISAISISILSNFLSRISYGNLHV